jgi:hypothetical protein
MVQRHGSTEATYLPVLMWWDGSKWLPQPPDVSYTTPSAVQNLRSTAQTDTSITLVWDLPATGDYAGAMIRYAVGSTPPATTTAGTLAGNFGGQLTTVAGLTRGTSYSFSVWAYSPTGGYSPAATLTVSTTGTAGTSRVWRGAATWSQPYQQDGSKRTLNTDVLWHGYGSSWGIQRSLVGFAVPAEVAGCLSVESVVLSLYWVHAYYNAGCTVSLGTHSHAAVPATWSAPAPLSTHHGPKPGWLDDQPNLVLPAAYAAAFRAGAKGIAVGPPPGQGMETYGYGAGVTYSNTSARPVLEIRYTVAG